MSRIFSRPYFRRVLFCHKTTAFCTERSCDPVPIDLIAQQGYIGHSQAVTREQVCFRRWEHVLGPETIPTRSLPDPQLNVSSRGVHQLHRCISSVDESSGAWETSYIIEGNHPL